MQNKKWSYCPHCGARLWVRTEKGIAQQCPICKKLFAARGEKSVKRDKTTGAGTRLTENNTQSTTRSFEENGKKSGKQKISLRKRFSAKRMALMAVFVALSYGVSFLEIPIFPAAPFLKLDFGNVFILLIALLLGPIEGIIVCTLKECLRLIGTSSGGVGEIANMAVTSAYILLPALVYRYRKGLKTVIPCLIAACFIGAGAALLANRYINFPLFMGAGAKSAFAALWGYVLGFNLIKTAAVGVLTALLYKRLSNFLKRIKI